MINASDFKNPAATYRPAPFWGLNGTLEADELKRQIRQFHAQGMGGAYLHPRGGMHTEYLSDSFFDAIAACLAEMEQLGMLGWLYDEDGFPSGKAGGKVIQSNPDFARRYIVRDETAPNGYTVLTSSSRTRPGRPPGKPNPRRIAVDVCDKAATDRFIEITHEQYYKRFAKYFGNVAPGFFTDEPSFKVGDRNARPWARDFEQKFKAAYGYDIAEHIADLFTDTENGARTRFHYWDLISSLFVEAFSKTIYDWCEAHHVAYMGHFWEHEFPSPLHAGSVMPHYAYMQYPGIDMLFVANKEAPEQYGNDFIVKEASSVANQLGRLRVLSETNGASGWALDFAYQKRAADWQLALGINLFCVHLAMYDMTGYRKRDFPLSYLDHQPWWDEFRLLSDYMGRMAYALSQGKYVADVLVLHPSSSTWVTYGIAPEKLTALSDSVRGLVKHLGERRIMYDLGDDILLSKHGKVADGKLYMGESAYRCVVVPSMYIMRGKVFELLKTFADNGGTIICAGEIPYLLDGEPAAELTAFFARPDLIHVPNEINAVADLFTVLDVKRIALRETTGKTTDSLYGHIRQQDEQEMMFLCNLDMDDAREVLIKLDKPYHTVWADGETGEISETPCSVHALYENGKEQYYITCTLNALQSALFLSDRSKLVPVCAALPPKTPVYQEIRRLTDWQVTLQEPNALHLQFCRVSLDGAPFSLEGGASVSDGSAFGAPADVLRLDDHMKAFLGMDRGSIQSTVPWMYTEEQKNDLHTLKAEYAFTVAELPAGIIQAAAELPKQFTLFINDVAVPPTGAHYKDRTFALYDITAPIKVGENIIRLETDVYGVEINLESVYVIGDFRLERAGFGFAMHAPKPLQTGNIVLQGCPYYSGKIEYRTKTAPAAGNARLTLGHFAGITAAVWVNGQKVKSLGWPVESMDHLPLSATEENEITVVIANSLQNLLGPFGTEANQNLVHPGSFYCNRHTVFTPTGFDGLATLYIEA